MSRKITAVRRHLARVAAVTVLATVGTVPQVGPATADELTCAALTGDAAATCHAYGDALLATMDALAPASSAAFAAQLATGYQLDESTTVVCTLGTTCDAWPVAALAATVATADTTACDFGDATVCTALRDSLAQRNADAVLTELAALVPAVAAAPQDERAGQLNTSLRAMLDRLATDADGQTVADGVVSVVTLAAALTPATTADTVIPNEAQRLGVVEFGEYEQDRRTCDLASTDTASGAGTGLVGEVAGKCPTHPTPPKCRGAWAPYYQLATYDSSDFNYFFIESWLGVDMVKPDPGNDPSCQEAAVRLHGTIFVEATSNGSSIIESDTKRSDVAQATRETGEGSQWSAWVAKNWETKKVEVTYGFPKAVALQFYSPPMGDYRSVGTARVEWLRGYAYPDHSTARNYEMNCTKRGSNKTYCTWRQV